ncbi:MAG: OmpA family protein [Saprospiraceae bacterium]|nr:OmpA family protein [Saprospiraceae bacterium]
MRLHLFIFLFPLLLTSCVSKKKHLTALANQEANLETLRRGEMGKLSRKINLLKKNIREHELTMASQKGSIETLEKIRKDLLQQKEELEDQLEATSAKSASSQESLAQKLESRNKKIKELESLIDDIDKTLEGEVVTIGTLAGDLRLALTEVDPNFYTLRSTRENLLLSMNEPLLFVKGSVSRLSDEGKDLLSSLAEVLQRFPTIKMEIMGHTDNSKPKSGYSDNWTISVIRSVAVTKELVNENGISSGQIKASGKGEYSPLGSNVDAEGQAQNRRVEILFWPAQKTLSQKIKRILE